MDEIKSAVELLSTDLPEREWAIHDFVPLGSLTVVAAKKGRGKSVLSLAMADAVAAGRTFLGRRTSVVLGPLTHLTDRPARAGQARSCALGRLTARLPHWR